MRHMTKAVASLLVLAVALALAAPVKAGPEAAKASGQSGLAEADAAAKDIKDGVKKWFAAQKKRIKNNETVSQCPAGTHPSYEGELGLVCRSDNPASVTCEIIGWRKVVDEMGERLVPILGECNPKGGWAGSNPRRDEPQAP